MKTSKKTTTITTNTASTTTTISNEIQNILKAKQHKSNYNER
jgi:hypothetical protein